MKLRSGKILIPRDIQKQLDDDLHGLSNLLVDNQDFAQELIRFIVKSGGVEGRFQMSDMIHRNVPRDIALETISYAGGLLILLWGYGVIFSRNNIKYEDFYRKGLHEKIKNQILNEFQLSEEQELSSE